MSFDAAKALIVRHADASLGGALPIYGSDGAMASQLAHSLDYNSRTNGWEEKGGIDREPTDEDLLFGEASRQLDYVSRMGGWSEKGADAMVDCSFFGQHGPVSREEVEADMMRCGGCFMRSFVSVERRNAAELGLTTKADFEALLRSTWAKSIVGEEARELQDGRKAPAVPGWGVTRNVHDVRWVANYHTDQENNLHCHITTWFEGGEGRFNEPGWMVTAAGTRGQKEIIYREAYRSPLREQVYPAKDYARAMAVAQAKVDLGIPLSDKERSRLRRLGRAIGAPSEPKAALPADVRGKVDARVERMREIYANGRGRKGGSYALAAAARDVHKELKKVSEPYAAQLAAYREQAGILADAKGLSLVEREADAPDESERAGAREVVAHERERYIKEQMEELVGCRIVPAIESIASRQSLEMSLSAESLDRAMPISELRKCLREDIGAKAVYEALRDGKANELVEKVLSSERGQHVLSRTVAEVSEKLASVGRPVHAESLEAAARSQLADKAEAFIEREAQGELSRLESKAVYHSVRTALAEVRLPVVVAAVKDDGLKIGLTRAEFREVQDIVRAVAAAAVLGSAKDEVARLAARGAEVIVSSPVVTQALQSASESLAKELGIPKSKAQEAVESKAKEAVAQQVAEKAPALQQQMCQSAAVQTVAMPDMLQSSMMGSSIGEMIATIASGLGKEAARQGIRRSGRSNGLNQSELDVSRANER